MKTLNKTLSLVLVLVMVLGLFGVASAKEFTDADDVTYTEAVDVMASIGVIDGYADGTIKPTATVTREEAAKLVAYSILGKDVADRLAVASTGFKDVEADRWSAPYIAYLVSAGIINGMGDGTFDPTANVTGYQMAKMMLVAAGYGAKDEFVGAGWELAVAVTGSQTGIFDDADGVDLNKPATREEATLYAFNGIQVGQVVYNEVFKTYLGKGQGIGATDAKGPSIMAEVYPTLVSTDAIDRNSANTISRFNGEDAFGNPANEWRLKTVDLGAYTIEPTFVYTSDKSGVTGTAAIEKELKSYAYKTTGSTFTETANAKLYVNGKDYGQVITSAAQIAAYTGNGRIVNVYVLNGNIERVVVMTPFLAKVSYVDSKNETVTVSVAQSKDAYAAAGAVIATTLGYGTVKVDDYVVVYPVDMNNNGVIAGDAIGALYPATAVTGKATQKSTTDETITIDGKAYEQGFGVGAATDVNAFGITDATDATLLLDENGYFLAAIPGTSVTSDKVIAVTKNYQTMKNNVITDMVRGYNSKGEVVDFALYGTDSDQNGSIDDPANIGTAPTVGGVYEFIAQTGANSGTYGFYPIDAVTQTRDTAANKTIDANNISKSTKAIDGYYFASDVKFIFADTTGDGKVTVTNGAQNLTNNTDITYCLKTVGSKQEIIAVFAQQAATASANAASELYFFGEVNGTKVVNGKTYYVYNVAKDGMPVDNCYGEGNNYFPGFYTAEIDKDTGAYTFSEYVNAAGLYTTNTPTIPGVGANPNTPFFPTASEVTGFNAARTAFTIGGTVLNTTNAKFIRLAPKGLGNATDLANLVTECDLGQHPNKYVVAFAIYDNTTGIASHVYYKLTDANFMLASVSTANVTDTTKVTATGFTVSAPAVIKAGDTITYTLTYDVAASYAGKADQIVFNAPAGTTVVGSDKASVAATTTAVTGKTAVFKVTVDDVAIGTELTQIAAATITMTADA